MWFLIKATETLSKFHENLVKILVLTESGQGLGKIWAGVVTLTARNHTRIDIGSRSSRVWGVKLIKSILAVVEKMKGFPDKEITFPINVVLEKQKTVLSIKLEIQDAVDISSSIIILSNNRLSRFLPLTRQEVSGYVAQQGSMEYWMDFHECREFKLNYQRVPFKNTLNWKETDMLII